MSKNQFGFMPGRSTMKSISCVRQLIEKKNNLAMIFINLENAYDRVFREVLWRVLKKKGFLVVYVKIIQAMYNETKTRVKYVYGETEDFTVKVDIHLSTVLSPYLFSLLMDKLTKDVQYGVSWYMMFANNMILIHENTKVLDGKHEHWQRY